MEANGQTSRRPVLAAGANLAEDASRSFGFGQKYHPRTLEAARLELAPQVSSVRESVRELPDRLRGERVYVRATLLPNYLAASHHPAHLRQAADLVIVGTRPARGRLERPKSIKENVPTKALLLAATEESLGIVAGLLEQEEPDPHVAEDLLKFQDFGLPAEERVKTTRQGAASHDPDEELVWEAVLHPAVDRSGRVSDQVLELVLARWKGLIESLDGELRADYTRRVRDLTFTPVRLKRRQVEAAATFNPLRSIRPMPHMRPLPTSGVRGVSLSTAARPPTGGPPAGRRIAVFDGGVDNSHPLLAPYVTEGDLTSYPRDDGYVAHGTLVTSALLYGHLETGGALESPPAHVDHFRVLPSPAGVDEDDEPYWVLDRILETLNGNRGRWHTVNLSYGPDETVDEFGDIDRFTAEIDVLAHEHDLTFVVAAGNDGAPTVSTLGDDRVMAPADGVNVLGVGACDAPGSGSPVRAPYSCVGPGRPGLRVQPLGVSFGGVPGRLFTGAEPGGGYQADAGTSFAAPTAARGLATLLASVPNFSTNLARGLAAHFADGSSADALVELGYGRLPNDYVPLLECSEGEITVVIRDSIARGTTRSYPLPYPRAGVRGIVEARWTASFTSPTDPQDPVEYTLAGLDLLFRPHRTRYQLDKKGEKSVKVDIRDAAQLQPLLGAGYVLGQNPLPRPLKPIRSEQTLRDEGKWETVVRHGDSMRSESLFLPELLVSYLERSEGQLVPSQAAQALDFTLVISVVSRRTTDLYEQVLADARFGVLAPLATPIAVTAGVSAAGS